MNDSTTFVPATPKAIGSVLDRTVSGLESAGRKFERRSLVNSIVLVPTLKDEAFAGKLIDLLAHSNPGRVLLLVCDSQAAEINVSVAARCHRISQESWGCSEVVRIAACEQQWPAIPNIVMSNLLTGASTELHLLGGDGSTGPLVHWLAPLAETFFIDSSAGSGSVSALRGLLLPGRIIVDLQWLSAAAWRDAIRDAFSRNSCAARIPELSEIKIECRGGAGEEIPAIGLLLGSWILNCLGLEAVAMEQRGFECRGRTLHRGCSLLINRQPAAGPCLLKGVEFRFGSSTADAEDYIQIKTSAAGIEIIGACGGSSRLTYALESTDPLALMQRYFAVGERIKGYRRALLQALELEALSRGYWGLRGEEGER